MLFASCVQKEYEKTITFKVDMTHVENVKNVGIKGNFTNQRWEETIPLTDENKDGIYVITLSQQTATNAIEFKFVNNDIYELKDQENRRIQFEYKPEKITYAAKFDSIKFEIIRK